MNESFVGAQFIISLVLATSYLRSLKLLKIFIYLAHTHLIELVAIHNLQHQEVYLTPMIFQWQRHLCSEAIFG